MNTLAIIKSFCFPCRAQPNQSYRINKFGRMILRTVTTVFGCAQWEESQGAIVLIRFTPYKSDAGISFSTIFSRRQKGVTTISKRGGRKLYCPACSNVYDRRTARESWRLLISFHWTYSMIHTIPCKSNVNRPQALFSVSVCPTKSFERNPASFTKPYFTNPCLTA